MTSSAVFPINQRPMPSSLGAAPDNQQVGVETRNKVYDLFQGITFQ